jgi:hypothetical protein
MGRWGDSYSVCCAREMVPVLSTVRGRPRLRAVASVGAQDRRGARGGDEGGVDDRECALHLLRTPAMLRVVLPVPHRSWLRAQDSEALNTGAAGGAVRRRGAGDGERLLQVLHARGGACKRPAGVWIEESGTCWRCTWRMRRR